MKKRFAILVILNLLPLSFLLRAVAIGQTSQENFSLSEPELVDMMGGRSYSIAVQEEFAYLAIGSRVEILNIDNPGGPVRIGLSEPLTQAVNKIYVMGDYALAFVKDGLYTVDVTNKTKPIFSGFFKTSGTPIEAVIAGNFVYVTEFAKSIGGNGGGLRIIDYSAPSMPMELSHIYSGALASGIVLHQNYAYMHVCLELPSGGCSATLSIVDITDVTSPTIALKFAAPTHNYEGDLAVVDSYLYHADSILTTYDISNPLSWTLIASDNIGKSKIYYIGSKLYLYNYG